MAEQRFAVIYKWQLQKNTKHIRKQLDPNSAERASVEVTAYPRDLDVVSAYERMYKRKVVVLDGLWEYLAKEIDS